MDADLNQCLNEGIADLNQYIIKHCKSAEQYEEMFNALREIPSEFDAEIVTLSNTFSKLKKTFEGDKKKSGTAQVVLDSTKQTGTSGTEGFGGSKTKQSKGGSGFQ